MKIIDMRCRPPFGPYLDQDGMFDMESKNPFGPAHFPQRFGMRAAQSVHEQSVERLLEEMNRAGEITGMVSIRKNSRGYENEALVNLLAQYPKQFMGACGVASDGGMDSIQVIKKYVVEGICQAVFIEPGFEGILMDDAKIFPIYEYCEQNHIPLLVSFGGFHGLTAEYCNALHAEAVASSFPNLKIALCHGGWPWVEAAVYLAFKAPNVYLSPDIYALHAAGGKAYMEAANYMLYDKFLYGSAYPCVDIEGSVAHYLDNLRPEVVENIMYKNAERFLNLSIE